MKYRFIIFGVTLLGILLMTSCKENCKIMHNCNDKRAMTKYEKYFPLEIGNKWTYSSKGEPNYYMKVVGKKEINGKNYFKLLHSSVGKKSRTIVYYRWEDSKLFEMYESDKLEYLLADFALEEGDMFQKNNTDQKNSGYDVTVLSDDPNEFTFYYDSRELADEEYTIVFGVDVGKLKERGGMIDEWVTLTSYDLHCSH